MGVIDQNKARRVSLYLNFDRSPNTPQQPQGGSGVIVLRLPRFPLFASRTVAKRKVNNQDVGGLDEAERFILLTVISAYKFFLCDLSAVGRTAIEAIKVVLNKSAAASAVWLWVACRVADAGDITEYRRALRFASHPQSRRANRHRFIERCFELRPVEREEYPAASFPENLQGLGQETHFRFTRQFTTLAQRL
jgi:hypothetical protein